MASHEDDQVFDASFEAQSQTRSGILTPVSDDSLNSKDDLIAGNKKRKRDCSSVEDLLERQFSVKPYPATVGKLRHLQPLILLPRSQLPLSALEFQPSAKSLPQARLFEADVKVLEWESRMGKQPMVLIARLDDNRTLYAVERESKGLYVLCQIGSWMNVRDLRASAVASRQETSELGFGPGAITRNDTTPSVIVPVSNQCSSRKRRAIADMLTGVQSRRLLGRQSSGLLSESQSPMPEPQPAIASQPESQVLDAPTEPQAENITVQLTAAEIFDNVRTQYLEALYLSKASLAYFAKGPLSRARAAFHTDCDSTLDMKDYVEFLQSIIMTKNVVDKKYKTGIPTCVSLVDIQDHSADEAVLENTKVRRRKSIKRIKPGKDGLYAAEAVFIRRWWAAHDIDIGSTAPGISRGVVTSRRISLLRIRETMLQLTLILEVLALQASVSSAEDSGLSLPTASPAVDHSSQGETGTSKKVETKKPDRLAKLIEEHIDYLSIWQGVNADPVEAPSLDSQISIENADGSNQEKHADTPLRDFCVDVIAPFFSSRLPKECAHINRELGGPVAITPPKPKRSKTSKPSAAPARPGAATNRPVPMSLEFFRSGERRERERSMSQGPNKRIAKMMSATMPIMPCLKRENSEALSLGDIPAKPGAKTGVNAWVEDPFRTERPLQRAACLSSKDSRASVKAEKQARIDADMKHAISTLRKPNRELVGRDIADTAEKRSTATFSVRKSTKPGRRLFSQPVQISATPKASRQIDIFATSQGIGIAKMFQEPEPSTIPAFSIPRIPQSASRPTQEGILSKSPLTSSFRVTPTGKSFAFSERMNTGNESQEWCPQSSPLQAQRPSGQFFSGIPASATRQTFFTSNGIQETPIKAKPSFEPSYGIHETPVKQRPTSRTNHSHPTPPVLPATEHNKNVVVSEQTAAVNNLQNEGASEVEEVTIYKSLGWDDDDELG